KASAMLDGVSSWHLNSAQEFTKVQNKIKDLVASGHLLPILPPLKQNDHNRHEASKA
ncbi:hypothetical protein G6K70_004468, partial [Salmonella enterica subsp. enterica serovar Rubislaw]|nr:hypothetical protein [Salmonella enterica subsp. enterica serovar Rubislaw]EEO4859371.1 hypothetical protein [Salmonella enterica subsp. enterica serovar Rubislaw]EEO4975755.1 hypothetical protein [Salmonella enterica subsp. enterica serovar Rubislaw]EEO7865763.1 hypothetical protein [Salmonella enterica subsp. enterica serovar Rubislaw]